MNLYLFIDIFIFLSLSLRPFDTVRRIHKLIWELFFIAHICRSLLACEKNKCHSVRFRLCVCALSNLFDKRNERNSIHLTVLFDCGSSTTLTRGKHTHINRMYRKTNKSNTVDKHFWFHQSGIFPFRSEIFCFFCCKRT